MRDWGERISSAERRAMAAERDAADRYMAAFMQDKVGASFDAAVSGVTRAGLFVTLEETGASGLIPASLLPDDGFRAGGRRRRSAGDEARHGFRIGQTVQVRLRDAVPVTGGLLFELLDSRKVPMRNARKNAKSGSKRGRY